MPFGLFCKFVESSFPQHRSLWEPFFASLQGCAGLRFTVQASGLGHFEGLRFKVANSGP